MPQIIVTENDAMDLLKSRSAYTVDPALDEANELLPILRQCVRATIWTANTIYTFGSVIIPTSTHRNGHRYKLVQFDGHGVSSGSTEPTWPRGDNSSISDGNLTWREDGVDYDCLWDIRRACWLSYDLKVQKISCQYDFKAGDSSDSMSQKIATLERMRNRFAPVVIG